MTSIGPSDIRPIELLLIGGAVAAQLEFGVFWVIPVVFGVAAAVVGFLATAKR